MTKIKVFVLIFFYHFVACQNNTETTREYFLTSTISVWGQNEPPNKQQLADSQSKQDVAIEVAPENMILVKGGYTFVGNDSSGLVVENPRLWIHVKPFFMDVSPVTVGQFRAFVQATQYVTEAEKFGNGAFIDGSSDNKWILKDGVTWEYPQGKDYPKADDKLPVTQVSWHDAVAYARWAGKRLPHEWEFEHAARNARNDQTLYSFGNSLKTLDGRWLTNIYQGTFPYGNRVEDGYKFASPIGIFGKTPLGLTDMTGNVWQWCDNGRFEYAQMLRAVHNGEKLILSEIEKAQRGGSYLCEDTWCHGYRVSGRSFTSPETSLMHVGFRCVKDVQ